MAVQESPASRAAWTASLLKVADATGGPKTRGVLYGTRNVAASDRLD